MKKSNEGKPLKIIKLCAIVVLAAVLGWLVPKAMTSLELHKYYKQLNVVSQNDIFVGRFSLKEGVTAEDFTDRLDGIAYVAGYMRANSVSAVSATAGGKSVKSTLIFKTGKWCEKNSYKIVDGNDLPDEYAGKIPVLVSEKQWRKASVGDDIKLSIAKSDGTEDTVEGYIVGKISNTTAIAGVHYYYTEPYEGNIIIPDIGVDKYIKNSAKSFAVMLNIGDGTMVDLMQGVEDLARAQVDSERKINYLAVDDQQNKTEYLIYLAVALAIAIAAVAFFVDKNLRMANGVLAAAVTLISSVIFTVAKFKKTPIYQVDDLQIFYANASLYLQGAIVPDIIFFILSAIIVFSAVALMAYLLYRKENKKINDVEATEKLYD